MGPASAVCGELGLPSLERAKPILRVGFHPILEPRFNPIPKPEFDPSRTCVHPVEPKNLRLKTWVQSNFESDFRTLTQTFALKVVRT